AGTITILNGATTGTATFTILDDADIEGTETATLTISNPSAGVVLGGTTTQNVTITDNDVAANPTVELSVSANAGTEAAGTVVTITATASAAVTGDQTVDIAASGAGITGTDYSLSAGTITILNGATTGTATFTILDDADIEGTETATLTISNPSAGLTLGAGTAQGITITDNEVAGFTIVESNGTTVVQESGTTDDFTVVLNVQPASNVTFNVTRSDVTEANVSPTVLTFTPANWNIPQTVIVTGLDDAVNDGDVISTVTVSPSSVDANFNGLADQVVSVTTINNDGAVNAVVELSVSANVGTEAASTVITVTATTSQAVTGNQTVDIAASGAGITGTDYSLSAGTITILNGATTGTATFTILDDADIEGTETATLTISNPSAGLTLGATATQNITITDNDFPEVNLSVSANTGTEAAGTVVTIIATASAAVTGNQTVDLVASGTGITGTDYSLSAGTITILDGATTGTATFTILDDADIEGAETATLTISNPSAGITLGATTTQNVVITDNDFPQVNLSVSANAGTEASGTVITVTATASVAVTGDQTVDLVASGTGITGTDYILSAGSIAILNGEATGSVTFTIQDDALGEGNETATLTISNPSSGVLLGTTKSRDVMITDNDPIEINLSANANSGSEIGTVITLQVTAAFPVVGDQTVDLSVSGTDITFTDYALINPTITILDGQTSNTISFTIQDDTYVEDTETATITMSNPSAGLALGATATLDITIIDNDVAGFNITESDGNTSVSETGTTDDFLVKLDRRPTSDVVIDISSGDLGEAAVSPTQLTFTINTWNTAQTVTVTGVDDNFVDGDQNTTITLSINDANSNDLFDPVADQTLTATTIDDDAVGFTVTQSDGNTSVSETGTTDEFTVVLSAQPASDVIIDVSSGDTGEATVSHASLTFTAANWNTPQTITVTGIDDALVDGNQNTTVTLSINDAGSDNSFDPLADQTITVTTVDDDTPGFTIVESDGNTEVSETGTTDNFTVVLSSQPTTDVIIDVLSGDLGEATVSPASLTFTTANWNTPQTVTVTGVDDALIDGNQTTNITLSVNDGSSDDLFDPLADQIVSAITTDNDFPQVNLSVSANAGTEVAGTVITVTTTASAAVTGDQTIDLAVSGTGITGTDYNLSAATITILDGATTGIATFTILDDPDIEGTETATLTISNPSAGITLGATTTQNVVITDNDVAANPTVELSVSANAGTETAGTVITVTATASAAVTGDQTIDLAVSGTGITGTDYNLSAATITILNGATTGTATFTILDDTDIEGSETATFTISNPSAGITLGTTITQDITITDNDFPEVNLSVSPNTGTEQDGTMIIVTATASSEVVGGKTVDLGISGAGITSTDYALSSTILTIPDGETTGTAILMIVDDEDIEGTETATLTITNPSAGIALGTTTTQDIIITDDDYTKPDPTNVNTTIMAAPSTLVADGTSASIITVMLSNANGDPLSISGGTVTLTTTGSASLSAVVDNNDGTYTATLTNTVVETVTITGQVDGEDIANNALVIFTPDLTDSDGDGVIDSDEDINGNGDLTDDDTDGDGIPNYLDPDDDGDGVPTKDEDVNKDGDPTNDDTDDDGVPNHLDEDDDGDGKSTEEEGTGDSDGDGTPDYLDTVDKVEAGQILSPNDDGINDVFILEDIEKYPENMVSIFNRKGNLVFEIQGYNNNDKAWRGLPNTGFLTNSDRIVPNGTYFYVVDLNDGERPITGFLVLKR
uniref:Calx-beta domain-containing protein n=1 Tax=uncultured Roseivirga sp. TaxID=543088 RepID=UPI0030D72828